MERVSGTTAVRQNLAQYPNFDYSGVLIPVRTNLCANPRGVLTMLHYSGAGAQTITPNIAVTAPEGITTAIRFTYDGSASNPGLNILSPISASTTYTMSAYVMIESLTSTPGGGGFAENGVISGTTLDNTKLGVWQKITWTRTTTASPGPNFGIRFAAVAGTGTTGSILVTGIMIETVDAANASPAFFDGATPAAAAADFTYSWNGTANASRSIQYATSLGGWVGTSAATAYQSSISPVHGTKLGGVLTKGGSGDGIYHNDVTVAQGLPYTVSAWIRLTSAVPNMSILFRWKDSLGNILKDDNINVVANLIVGQMVRVSATVTSFTGSSKLQPMFRIQAAHTPTTFYVDSMLIEQSAFLSGFFDGSTAAIGDFTYAWLGTAGQSISEERAPSVAGYSGLYSGGRIAWSSSDWSAGGNKSLAVASPKPTVDSFSQLNTLPNVGNNMGGKTYTILAKIKTTEPFPTGADGRAWSININLNLSGGGQFQYNFKPVTTHAGVHEIRQIVKIRDDATSMVYMRLYNGSPNPSTVYWDNLMIVEGAYLGDYIDGNKPFSKWDGMVQASTSVGYPPQLLDLAGAPVHDVTAVGSTTLSGGFGNTEPRTIYTVYQNFAEVIDSTVPIILTYGANALTDAIPNQFITLRQQLSNNTGNNLIARRTGGAGPLVSRSMLAINVATWGIDETGKAFIQVNNEPTATDTVAMDIPNERMVVIAPSAASSHIRTLIYRGLHDAATRAAVSRYLGNKYGGYVA